MKVTITLEDQPDGSVILTRHYEKESEAEINEKSSAYLLGRNFISAPAVSLADKALIAGTAVWIACMVILTVSNLIK